jgi:ethanolamine utilization protein EutA (predicted chaperonin)
MMSVGHPGDFVVWTAKYAFRRISGRGAGAARYSEHLAALTLKQQIAFRRIG